jgi:hypothetical protein
MQTERFDKNKTHKGWFVVTLHSTKKPTPQTNVNIDPKVPSVNIQKDTAIIVFVLCIFFHIETCAETENIKLTQPKTADKTKRTIN